jgi:DNA-binding NarL/FixJ family response regulator
VAERVVRVLLLAESEAEVGWVVEALERAELHAKAERVSTEAAFVAALERFRPDVVLSGSTLAGFGTPEALRVLREHRPGTPLIVVSGALQEDIVIACLRAGAANVVSKEDPDRLGVAIESALRVREPLERLSDRQLEVLRLVAEGRSTPSIARELQLSAKTVDTHRTAVMRRLGIHDRAGLVRYAVRVGLVAPDPERR